MMYLLTYINDIQFDQAQQQKFTVNPDIFPSSFFLQSHKPYYTSSLPSGPACHPSFIKEEQLDFLTSTEREFRIKHNYVFDYMGIRKYQINDGHFKYQLSEMKDNNKYKKFSGYCIIFSISNDYYHSNHAVVQFEFQPKLAPQTLTDLNVTLTNSLMNPSFDFVIDKGIFIGMKLECSKWIKINNGKGGNVLWNIDEDGWNDDK